LLLITLTEALYISFIGIKYAQLSILAGTRLPGKWRADNRLRAPEMVCPVLKAQHLEGKIRLVA